MMSPEMMKMASEMMSKMSPEELARMQAMAANMSPDMMQQAMAATGATPEQLKAEGNRLHSAREFRKAAEAYQSALKALQGQNTQPKNELRTICQSNLASCFLQLERWQGCVDMCDTVLSSDSKNRKALFRRGQALCSLGRYTDAVSDLREAMELSPESERHFMREKLQEAEAKQQQERQGYTVEEVAEPAAPGEQRSAKVAAAVQEGLGESDTDEEMPPLGRTLPPTSTAAASVPSFVAQPPGMGDRQQAAEMLKNNPEMARQAAAAMAAMSDDQIASMAAQSGMPGITPAMAKQAAAMMRNMPPEQLQAMAAQASAAGGAPPGFPAASRPAAPAASQAAAVAAPGGGDQMAAAADVMRRDPAMMKQAAAMMEGMSEEELNRMAAMAPGGMKVDPAQMKMAAKMMAGMSPAEMERMTQMAASMGVGGPALGAAASGPSTSAGAAAVGTSDSAATVGGMPPGFDPTNMSADTMAQMRERMQDPAMLKMMKDMMKGMDPKQLSEIMKASGANLTPEQARSLVDKLDSVSDKHLEVMAKLLGWFNAATVAYRSAKAWLFSQGALTLAVLVLIIGLLLRWWGWF